MEAPEQVWPTGCWRAGPAASGRPSPACTGTYTGPWPRHATPAQCSRWPALAHTSPSPPAMRAISAEPNPGLPLPDPSVEGIPRALMRRHLASPAGQRSRAPSPPARQAMATAPAPGFLSPRRSQRSTEEAYFRATRGAAGAHLAALAPSQTTACSTAAPDPMSVARVMRRESGEPHESQDLGEELGRWSAEQAAASTPSYERGHLAPASGSEQAQAPRRSTSGAGPAPATSSPCAGCTVHTPGGRLSARACPWRALQGPAAVALRCSSWGPSPPAHPRTGPVTPCTCWDSCAATAPGAEVKPELCRPPS